MRPLLLFLALAQLALPARSEVPLDATGFDAHVTGYTITYQQFDFVFGVEEYLPDRKVRWSVAPGDCQYGSWYPEGDQICFVYEDDPVPHCWRFWLEDGALVALGEASPPGTELVEIDRSTTPLSCPGPDVGA